jgi:hypothetical protein
MTNARVRLACAFFFSRAWGTSRMLGEPSGSRRPLPLARFADKTLRVFPTPLLAHAPEAFL